MPKSIAAAVLSGILIISGFTPAYAGTSAVAQATHEYSAIAQSTTGADNNNSGLAVHSATYSFQQDSATLNVKDFRASGSDETITGSIRAGSNTLSLVAPIDFKNGEGISIANAGALPTISAPTSLTIAPTGTTGSTNYTYAVAAIDGNGGVTTVFSASTSTGNTTLSSTNYNGLSVGSTTGAVGYAWYRTASSGSPATTGLIYVGFATSLNDIGLSVITPPVGIPSSAPTLKVGDLLVTSIASGAGSTTLTLANNAVNTATNVTVNHDDTAALSSAIQSGNVFMPAGNYILTSNDTITKSNIILSGVTGKTILEGLNIGSVTLAFKGSNNLDIQNLTFRNGLSLSMYNTSNTHTVNNCTFQGSTFSSGTIYTADDTGTTTIENSLFNGASSSISYAGIIYAGDNQQLNLINNSFINTKGTPLTTNGQSLGLSISGNHIYNAGYFLNNSTYGRGLTIYQPQGTTQITNNTINTTSETGIIVSPSNSPNASVTIKGNILTHNGGNAIESSLHNQVIDDNVISYAGANGIWVGGVSTGSVITNNTVSDSQDSGIYGYDGMNHFTITGNTVYNNNQSKGSFPGINLNYGGGDNPAIGPGVVSHNIIFDNQGTLTQGTSIGTVDVTASTVITANTGYNPVGHVTDTLQASGLAMPIPTKPAT